ncbi:heterokaryon incompatibility protein-domain-containing protein [Immersiella caudata]|uniref:Heterokaryon incompatibility protein-domain-containing protein n=1 Tax=Immersiella caudata TaxID=314043 RepID=A0AA39WP97_9PEZI|nr:heterokaryon incompatibility protein-domain-containing protein [Immersiella caudata]
MSKRGSEAEIDDKDVCAFCSELISATRSTSGQPIKHAHHATFALLSLSAKICPLCDLIASQWSSTKATVARHGVSEEAFEVKQPAFEPTLETTEAHRMDSGVSWASMMANLHTNEIAFTMCSNFTLTTCSSKDPASALSPWRTPAPTFEDRVVTIQSWLNRCSTHIECRPVPYAPLRLLSIDLKCGPLRLVSRDTAADMTKYATLSYCWGNSLPLRTTRETLPHFRDEIPPDLIPPTWADAIRIARAVRIPYIWIDALCIVQDDEVEWQREVGHMADIYQGSFLTIAAVQAADSSEGCFPSHASRPQDNDLFFRMRPDDATGHRSFVRAYTGSIRNRAIDAPLSNRGWTLQEQILSPRLLHCMQPEMHWQCRAGYQTEGGITIPLSNMLMQGRSLTVPHGLPVGDPSYGDAWRNIVGGYSHRDFTYPRDRIPAFAGITRYYSLLLDDVPLLGLWRKSFARDLSFMRSTDPSEVFSNLRLPSWSWFACPGSVFYGFWGGYQPEDEPVIDALSLLSWDVQWEGVPLASQVRSAHVIVMGPVREIRIVPFELGNRHKPPYLQVFDEDLKQTATSRFPWRCAGEFDAGRVTTPGTYLCLLLFHTKRTEKALEVFLILEPTETESGEEVKFRRVGVAKITGDSPTFDLGNTRSLTLV